MPMLRRGYVAVKNLRCKSGARFPPSTDWMYVAKTYRCALGPWLSLDVSDPRTHTTAYKGGQKPTLSFNFHCKQLRLVQLRLVGF